MELISIIIPIYNAERYLRPCLDSILQQTYSNWELIAVDDGSVDSSRNILEDYARRDNRIKIISKVNEGVSIARNTGLKFAKGTYVYFADADDLVYSHALQTLVTCAVQHEATMVKADFKAIDEQDEEIFVNKKYYIRSKYKGGAWTSEKFYHKVLMNEYFLWTCLFRIDVIRENKLYFLPYCRLMEDADFMIRYLMVANRNFYIQEQIYGYRKYATTATVVTKDYSTDLEAIFNHLFWYHNNCIVQNFLSRISMSVLELKRKTDRTENLWNLSVNYFPYQCARINVNLGLFVAKCCSKLNKLITYVIYRLDRI